VAGPRGGRELELNAHPQTLQPQPLSSRARKGQSKLGTRELGAPIDRGSQGREAPARVTKVIRGSRCQKELVKVPGED